MYRISFLGFLLVLWGCSEQISSDKNKIMIDQEHSHYHVHSAEVEHGHEHNNFQLGGHKHGHNGHE
jgi:hypothetical protein